MQLDAVTIAVIAGIVAVLLLATAAARRGGGVDRDRGPFSSSTESQAGFAALGTTNPAARYDDDPTGHDHGPGSHGHDHPSGGHSHGGGDSGGGHTHGGDAGGDAGGGSGNGD